MQNKINENYSKEEDSVYIKDISIAIQEHRYHRLEERIVKCSVVGNVWTEQNIYEDS